jgi:alpha-mannosidase
VKINPDGHLTVKSAEGSFTREFSSLLYFEEQADIGDEYVFMPLKDENPLNSRNRKTKIKWLVKSDFVQQVEIISSLECPVSYDEKNNIRSREKSSLKIRTVLTLTKGSRRLDVVNQVDNTISDHRLRVCFDIPWQVNNYFAQTQFSSKCHSVQLPPESQNWREVPTAIRRNFGWLAAWEENGENGFAVMPQGLHEHTVENNTLKLTLLRSVGILGKQAGPGILTPDAQCLGRQTFEYSLVFFNRNSIPGNYLWQEYQSYTRPPKAIICSISSEITKYKHSFFSLKSEKLVLSALRKRQNKKGREVRLYNISDEEALGTINVYVKDGSGLEHYFKELSIVPHALKMLEMNPDVRFSPK